MTTALTPPSRPAGWRRRGPRSLLAYYGTTMRASIASQFQYRVAQYFYMIGMVAEPVVYLVVWSTVAEAQGGSVGGIDAGGFAAYYIVWTLVRNMNIVLTPFAWEQRIREGRLSGELMRPVHPLHHDLAWFAGWKVVAVVLWLPVAAVLAVLFRPSFEATWQGVLAFAVAIWGAYLIRTMIMWLLGLLTFWTTRAGALFQLFFTAELLLSGRLAPLSLMPEGLNRIASWTPFPSTFGFPIDALVGGLGPDELVRGLATQAAWTVALTLVVLGTWRVAVRRYTAVGN